MRLLNFSKVFEVACDVSGIGIGGASLKKVIQLLTSVRSWIQRYSTYDKEFYAVIQALRYWRHYLLPHEFVLFSDHEALKYIYSQKKLNTRHGRWTEFLQDYTFTLRHKAGVKNNAADALSCRIFILTKMSTVINGFEKIKAEYESCPNFCDIYAILIDGWLKKWMVIFCIMSISFYAESYASQEPPLENFLCGNCMPVV